MNIYVSSLPESQSSTAPALVADVPQGYPAVAHTATELAGTPRAHSTTPRRSYHRRQRLPLPGRSPPRCSTLPPHPADLARGHHQSLIILSSCLISVHDASLLTLPSAGDTERRFETFNEGKHGEWVEMRDVEHLARLLETGRVRVGFSSALYQRLLATSFHPTWRRLARDGYLEHIQGIQVYRTVVQFRP